MANFDLSLLQQQFYFPKHSALENLSKKQQLELLQEYYSDQSSVASLIDKYNLKIRVSDLSRSLPYLEVSDKCPYDGKKMYKRIPSKTNLNWDGNEECFYCGHIAFSKHANMRCGCSNCVDMRISFHPRLQKCLSKKYLSKRDYESTTLYDKVLIAALLQFSHIDKSYDIQLTKRTYGNYLSGNSIDYLIDNQLIIPSANNDPEDFVAYDLKKKLLRFENYQILWRLNISFKNYDEFTTFEIAQNPSPEFITSRFETKELKHRLIVQHFVDKIRSIMDILSLNIRDPQIRALKNRIIQWLHEFTPMEVEKACWQTIANMDPSVTRIYDDDQLLDIYENHLQSVKVSNQDKEDADIWFNEPELNVFFNDLCEDKDWMNQLVYTDEVRLPTTSSEQLDEMEKHVQNDYQEISDLLEDATGYLVWDWGVILQKKNKTVLISDELTVYSIQKRSRSQSNWISLEDTNIKIEKYYSLGFIIALIQDLESSDLPKKHLDELF